MESHVMGINYGRIANNLPSPDEAVQKIKSLKIGRVKVFNSDGTVLSALANTGLEVVSALPNEDIPGVAQSMTAADQWVNKNVLAYYPATNIVSIIVGNELFSYPAMKPTWAKLMPAIDNVHTSLAKHNLTSRIKLSTAVALDVLANSYPPSAGVFKEELVGEYLQPLLKFLYNSQSHFYVNVYPYFAWASDPDHIPLDYALFGASTPGITENGKSYYNLLDGQLDAVYAALDKAGYGQVRLAISETGWPTAGDANQVGANEANAATYNRRLVRKMLSTSKVGTPMRPGVFIPTFIFALFNENLKTGQGTEKHWGVMFPNGTNVYNIDMTGTLSDGQYSPLADNPVFSNAPPPTHSPGQVPATSGTWCVAKSGMGQSMTQAALDFACGAGGADCQPLQHGGSCFTPDTLHDHASYAFNSYYQKTKAAGGSCNFGGAAMLTTADPSKLAAAHTSHLVFTWPQVVVESRRGESGLAFSASNQALVLCILSILLMIRI